MDDVTMSYPTDEQLNTIKTWAFKEMESFERFLAYVKSVGQYWPENTCWTQDGRTYEISTGGWSGNESILDAMQTNFTFWAVCWYSHRRGGHYIFRLPDPAKYFITLPKPEDAP